MRQSAFFYAIDMWYDVLENDEVSEETIMLLVLDTGNTNIVLGVYEQGQLKHHWRMETYRHKDRR